MNSQQEQTYQRKIQVNQNECQLVRGLKMFLNQNCNRQTQNYEFFNSEKQNSILKACRIKDLQESGKLLTNKTENQKPDLEQKQKKTSIVCKENSISKRIHDKFLIQKQKEHLQLIYCSIGLLIMLVLIFHQNHETKIQSLF